MTTPTTPHRLAICPKCGRKVNIKFKDEPCGACGVAFNVYVLESVLDDTPQPGQVWTKTFEIDKGASVDLWYKLIERTDDGSWLVYIIKNIGNHKVEVNWQGLVISDFPSNQGITSGGTFVRATDYDWEQAWTRALNIMSTEGGTW